MTYKISKIILSNFKAYDYLDFYIKDKFSLILGANNIGKTNLFEALLLWDVVYKKLIANNDRDFNKASSNFDFN